jgi:acetyl-CoA carboxylase carboxyl transferase subunit beta
MLSGAAAVDHGHVFAALWAHPQAKTSFFAPAVRQAWVAAARLTIPIWGDAMFRDRPRMSPSAGRRRGIPDGLWLKCPACRDIAFVRELKRNGKVCAKCDYHYPLSAEERIRTLVVSASFRTLARRSEVVAGTARIGDVRLAIGAVDPSAGRDIGADVLAAHLFPVVERAAQRGIPMLLAWPGVVAAGRSVALGREGVRLCRALQTLGLRGLPYVLLLTDPDAASGYACPFPPGDVVLCEAQPPVAGTPAPPDADGRGAAADVVVPRKTLAGEIARILVFLTASSSQHGRGYTR